MFTKRSREERTPARMSCFFAPLATRATAREVCQLIIQSTTTTRSNKQMRISFTQRAATSNQAAALNLSIRTQTTCYALVAPKMMTDFRPYFQTRKSDARTKTEPQWKQGGLTMSLGLRGISTLAQDKSIQWCFAMVFPRMGPFARFGHDSSTIRSKMHVFA